MMKKSINRRKNCPKTGRKLGTQYENWGHITYLPNFWENWGQLIFENGDSLFFYPIILLPYFF